MGKLISVLARYPVFPVFDRGKSLMQPVFVDDLADGILAAIGNAKTEGQAYNLAGPETITCLEIIETILAKLGRRVHKINININLAYRTTKHATVLEQNHLFNPG